MFTADTLRNCAETLERAAFAVRAEATDADRTEFWNLYEEEPERAIENVAALLRSIARGEAK